MHNRRLALFAALSCGAYAMARAAERFPGMALENIALLDAYDGAGARRGKPDEMQDAIEKCVLDIITLFAEQGHSGFSASYVTSIVEKLMRFEPLRPLTGEDGEWTEVTDGVFQNKRCSHVFKENGEAYDIDGIVFREPSGACFTGRDSRVPVTFPYTPTTEYRDVEPEAA